MSGEDYLADGEASANRVVIPNFLCLHNPRMPYSRENFHLRYGLQLFIDGYQKANILIELLTLEHCNCTSLQQKVARVQNRSKVSGVMLSFVHLFHQKLYVLVQRYSTRENYQHFESAMIVQQCEKLHWHTTINTSKKIKHFQSPKDTLANYLMNPTAHMICKKKHKDFQVINPLPLGELVVYLFGLDQRPAS